jgi:hypothetical protein
MSFDDLLTPKPYRWPKRGDLPFQKAKSAEATGTLVADGVSRAVFIMEGFMRAGAELADLMSKEPLSRFDLVYPMLFCYRHAVETGLKWLIAQYGPPVGVIPLDLNNTHDLLRLWSYFVKVNEACGADANDEGLQAVCQIVKQFHDWDKEGMKFRYAAAKNGATARFQHSNVDVENLKDVMSGVANFFSGSDGWLDNIANASVLSHNQL